MFELISPHVGRVVVLGLVIACVSAPLYAAQRFNGVWIVKQNNEQCKWTPPPYQIRIVNGRIIGLSGTVSPSGEIRWSNINKEGNHATLTGQLRGSSGSGRVFVMTQGTPCQGTFTMTRRR